MPKPYRNPTDNFISIQEKGIVMSKNIYLYSILKKAILYTTILFLLTIPIFYMLIVCELNGRSIPNLYVSLRFLRLMLVLMPAFSIRKKNKDILFSNKETRKFTVFFLGCIAVSILLHIENITPKLYRTISDTVGIYGHSNVPLLFSVLWEQMLSGDLYWSLLLSLLIIFFHPSPQYKCSDPTAT